MTRHQKEERPVTDDEFEQFPDRITAHFDRIRAALREALESESESSDQ